MLFFCEELRILNFVSSAKGTQTLMTDLGLVLLKARVAFGISCVGILSLAGAV
jgi:hypothetical protein